MLAVKNGRRTFRLRFEGTLTERDVQAAVTSIVALSGVETTPEVQASMVHVGVGIVILLGSFAIWYQNNSHNACQDMLQACTNSAIASCSPYGVDDVDVDCGDDGSFGQEGSSSATSPTSLT